MNVAIIISRLTRTGPVNVIYNLVRYLDQSRIIPFVFTLNKEDNSNSRLDEFSALGVKVICLAGYNRFLNLRKAIKEYRIDILHAHCVHSAFLCSFIKIKKIITVHQNFYYEWKVCKRKIFRLLRIEHNWRIKRFDVIVPCAEWLVPVIQKHCPNSKIISIPNGVIDNSKEKLVDNPLLNEKELKQKIQKAKIFMYIGSIDDRKKVKVLAEQFSKKCSENEILVCIGTGPLYEDIKKMNLKNVFLLGFRHNIDEYIPFTDFIISFSSSEGLPMAILEGLSFSKPLLLSDISAHKEILSKLPNAGICSKSIEELLDFARKCDYQILSDNARQVFEQYYSAKVMADKYCDLYMKLQKENCNKF